MLVPGLFYILLSNHIEMQIQFSYYQRFFVLYSHQLLIN
jgi:hypothetical protein